MKVRLKHNQKIVRIFADSGIEVTWQMLDDESRRWGAWIQESGVCRLGLCMGNCPECLYALTGALRVGVPVVMIPVTGSVMIPECTEIYDDRDYHVRQRRGIPLTSIQLTDGTIREYSWHLDETILFMSTSGTSGNRKWVEKSWKGYVNAGIKLLFRGASTTNLNVINASPFYHNTGMTTLMPLLCGICVPEINIGSFHPLKVQQAMQKYKPQVWIGTSTMLYRSCDVELPGIYVPPTVVSSGEPLYPHVMQKLCVCDSFQLLLNVYGTTETGNIAGLLCVRRPISALNSFLCVMFRISGWISNVYQIADAQNGLVGDIMKENKISILDSDENGIGRVTVLTKTMAQGLENQYYDTGDLGYVDGNKLYLTGRKNRVINHSGEKRIVF